jgi:DnaK suppressor protein
MTRFDYRPPRPLAFPGSLPAGPRSALLAEHLPNLRAALAEQRRFRIEQLAALASADLEAGLVAEHARLGSPDTELGEINRTVRNGAALALAEIEAALNRIDNGSYGRCLQCSDRIPLERLEILPMAGCCMPCQREQDDLSSAEGRPASRD